MVPAAAIQRGAGGAFVYVMKPDRPWRSAGHGRSCEGDDVAVDAGLAAGELVVVDGADRLREGARVVAQASPETLPRSSARALHGS